MKCILGFFLAIRLNYFIFSDDKDGEYEGEDIEKYDDVVVGENQTNDTTLGDTSNDIDELQRLGIGDSYCTLLICC